MLPYVRGAGEGYWRRRLSKIEVLNQYPEPHYILISFLSAIDKT